MAVAAVLEGGDQPPAERDPPEDVFLPAKLLNNAAALHLRGGEKEAALDLMYEAIEVGNTRRFRPPCWSGGERQLWNESRSAFSSIQLSPEAGTAIQDIGKLQLNSRFVVRNSRRRLQVCEETESGPQKP